MRLIALFNSFLLLILFTAPNLITSQFSANSSSNNKRQFQATNGFEPKNRGFKSRQSSSSGLSPVILIPGDGGSRLQAKLNRTDVAHHYCERRSTDWFDLWVNLSALVPFAIDCWVEK